MHDKEGAQLHNSNKKVSTGINKYTWNKEACFLK